MAVAISGAVPGDPHRLGATWNGHGTNFAVWSSAASYGGSVQLCLLDDAGNEERIPLWMADDVWHAFLPGVGPGQRYGFRVDGPRDPSRGLLFNPQSLLLDPYARSFAPTDPSRPQELVGLVVDNDFDWGDDRAPKIPWTDTVVYETHVKGISIAHPQVPAPQRGTYAGLVSPPILQHLIDLGVTTIELLPVQQFLTERFLLDRGLTNYWGYSTIGFFAPHGAYSSAGSHGQQVTEFKRMVKEAHSAGLEVILDVVFNHTAEGPPHHTALSFRGLGNEVYYRLDPVDPSVYVDLTGTGNTLDAGRPEVLRLIMDSLRYWALEMQVDGFRFDLAVVLARQHGYFDRLSAFFDLVYQDPVIGQLKLIAEPWDLGRPDGYQAGRFPLGWAEWNDRFRNGVRDFWRRAGGVADLGFRLTGSSDLYAETRRGPYASINFVVAHDGKTLTDLVTYEGKYNQANGQDNRDGTDDDRASNYGIEGPTDDPEIVAIRQRQQRNFIATLILSQGVPMICGGDEMGRTQGGNNNAYCQDNEISWYDWSLNEDTLALIAFTKRVLSLRRAHPALRRRSFLNGRADGSLLPDISWYDSTGQPMTVAKWQDPRIHSLALLLAGDQADLINADGSTSYGDDLLVILNADTSPFDFTIPGRPAQQFQVVLDTARPDGMPSPQAALEVGTQIRVAAQTVLVATAPVS